ncbi:MAG: hypothetical protein R3A52_01865 [Polyangiales bacterium]
MRKDPDERVSDARAFADAVATYLGHRGSERLVDVAAERLDALRALEPGADPPGARRLWTEASFALQQSIEAWSDNPRAAEGLREGTALMVRHELAARTSAPPPRSCRPSTLRPPRSCLTSLACAPTSTPRRWSSGTCGRSRGSST